MITLETRDKERKEGKWQRRGNAGKEGGMPLIRYQRHAIDDWSFLLISFFALSSSQKFCFLPVSVTTNDDAGLNLDQIFILSPLLALRIESLSLHLLSLSFFTLLSSVSVSSLHKFVSDLWVVWLQWLWLGSWQEKMKKNQRETRDWREKDR